MLAIFSAVAVYRGVPYFAQSPLLYSIAATLMFAIEVSLFEFCIRAIEGNLPPFLEKLPKQMARVFMDWVEEDPFYSTEEAGTPRGLLKFLHAAGTKVLASGFFLTIAWAIWQRYSCSDQTPFRAWITCARQAILPCILVVLIGLVYHLSTRSARVELSIAEKLFSTRHMPKDWIGPKDPLNITISVIAFFALYILLASLSNHIRLVSITMFAIACIDFNTRRLIKTRIEKYFADYEPLHEDANYRLIRRRREVIQEFLCKPHLWKEAARAGGCAIAFAIAMTGERSLSYVVLIITLIINEIVTARWRAERYTALLSLEARA